MIVLLQSAENYINVQHTYVVLILLFIRRIQWTKHHQPLYYINIETPILLLQMN